MSALVKETILYLFNANEPFNFNFVFIVIEKDISHHDLLD